MNFSTDHDYSQLVSPVLHSEILSVSEQARTMARRLIAGADLWLPVPTSYHDLTVALIPPPLRERFGFSLSDAQERQIRQAVALTRRLYPLLPARLLRVAGQACRCGKFWINFSRRRTQQNPLRRRFKLTRWWYIFAAWS
jgi:hypothetical protein